jgi:hypothetical protein
MSDKKCLDCTTRENFEIVNTLKRDEEDESEDEENDLEKEKVKKAKKIKNIEGGIPPVAMPPAPEGPPVTVPNPTENVPINEEVVIHEEVNAPVEMPSSSGSMANQSCGSLCIASISFGSLFFIAAILGMVIFKRKQLRKVSKQRKHESFLNEYVVFDQSKMPSNPSVVKLPRGLFGSRKAVYAIETPSDDGSMEIEYIHPIMK